LPYSLFAVNAVIANALQVRSGQRPVVLVGDGAFQMTGMELCNCRKLGISPIVVVFNNASWATLAV
jgi:indolepyruvate decarboxylase